VVPVEEHVAVVRVDVVAARVADAAAVNSVAARDAVVEARAVASSAVDVGAARAAVVAARALVDAVPARPVAAVAVAETSLAPTLPTPALSPAWAHRFPTQSRTTQHDSKLAVSQVSVTTCTWRIWKRNE
jgi:hypothetical protein